MVAAVVLASAITVADRPSSRRHVRSVDDRGQRLIKLSGYLPHRVTVAGPFRYLYVMVDLPGADDRVIGVIAHELQHAVEVADAPEVRSDRSLARLFALVHINFHCGDDCFETQAAIDVQYDVIGELKASRPPSTLASR